MLHWRAHLHPNTVAAPANILAIIRTTILTSGTRLLFIIVVCYSNKTGTTATAVYIVAPSDDPLHRLHRSSTAADSEATNAAAGILAGASSSTGTSGSGHEDALMLNVSTAKYRKSLLPAVLGAATS